MTTRVNRKENCEKNVNRQEGFSSNFDSTNERELHNI